MISGPCGRMSIGNTRRPQVGVVDPAAGDLRRQRRRRPGVHDVGVADEAAGLAALVVGVARADVSPTGRSAASSSAGTIGWSWSTSPSGAERVPQRDRHAEEALAADQPVAVEALDPVVVAVAHVVGEPVQLLAAQRGTPRAGPASRPPLRMYHWRLVTISSGRRAALVELHRVGDRPRVAVQLARRRSSSTIAAWACLTVSPASSLVGGSRPASVGQPRRVGGRRCGRRGR